MDKPSLPLPSHPAYTKPLFRGFMTGIFFQLALGPVFFFIANLTLQRSLLDGLAGAFAVTIVDYLYITLAIVGVGTLLEHKRVKPVFGMISSIVLILFGMLIVSSTTGGTTREFESTASSSVLSSFIAVFVLAISSPMTIVVFTSLFTAKAIELGYKRRDLALFGLGTGSATFLFMGLSVIAFSCVRGALPPGLVRGLNIAVGVLLMGYGTRRIVRQFRGDEANEPSATPDVRS